MKGRETDPHDSQPLQGQLHRTGRSVFPAFSIFIYLKFDWNLEPSGKKWSHGGMKRRRGYLERSTFCSLAKVMLCLGCACTEWALRWEWGRKRRVVFDRSLALDAGARRWICKRMEGKKVGRVIHSITETFDFPALCQLNNSNPLFASLSSRCGRCGRTVPIQKCVRRLRKHLNVPTIRQVPSYSFRPLPACSHCPTQLHI